VGENSAIAWTHHTFNPWVGCTKVDPGCTHCYAEGWAKRTGQVAWGPGEPRRRTSETYCGIDQTIRRHKLAVELIEAHGVGCLDEVPMGQEAMEQAS
jgi:protein gp37